MQSSSKSKRIAAYDTSNGRLMREFYDSPWVVRGLYLIILLNSATYPVFAFVMVRFLVEYYGHSDEDDF